MEYRLPIMLEARQSKVGGGPLTPTPDIFSAAPPTNSAKPVPRQSPRKSSSTRIYPTPRSMSPSLSRSPARGTSVLDILQHPPSFASSRHANGQYTPYSPYRPGEYQRTERVAPSERTKIERKVERKLFEDDEDELSTPRNDMSSSSPLAPAFEAKMKLRNGACIDIVSWLRTNFHWRHEQTAMTPSHTDVNPSMSALQIRRLVSERFFRVIEVKEILHAVTTAFPKSEWKYPDNGNPNGEPPIMHGLTWHGRDIAEEEDLEATPTKSRPHPNSSAQRAQRATLTTDIAAARTAPGATSRSPTQSTLMSPISSSTRRALPDTPATRSVLEEFAEIATQSERNERTPLAKKESLPLGLGAVGDIAFSLYGPPAAFADLASAYDPSRKRRASASPDASRRRRASTPDKLSGLVAAAEALEGSPLNTVLQRGHGHKRRRTIANPREIMNNASAGADVNGHGLSRGGMMNSGAAGRFHRARGTASPRMPQESGMLPNVNEEVDALLSIASPSRNSAASPPVSEESHASNMIAATWPMRAATSSSASHLSTISGSLPVTAGPSSISSAAGPGAATMTGDHLVSPRPLGRKINELPSATQGLHPGYDCKPPHPYHEMIRDAIESTPDRKLQLAQIYSTIADKYPFFKTLDEKKTAGWQNSIRHNLSLKKMFVRVNKGDGVPDDSGGKGGWWTVDPGIPDEGRPGRKAKSRKKEATGRSGTGGTGSTAEASESDPTEERQEVTPPTQISGRAGFAYGAPAEEDEVDPEMNEVARAMVDVSEKAVNGIELSARR